MPKEKRMIESYEVRHAVQLAGGEAIFAVDASAELPYMVCDCSWANMFGVNEYKNAVVGDDPVEMLRIFTTRLSERMDSLEAERNERCIPFKTLTVADCQPKSMDTDLNGRVVVIRSESLAPEYRTIDHQLALCYGGNGSRPEAIGRAVYCKDLFTGKSSKYERLDIAGAVLSEHLPDWAREKLAVLQEPAERESVVEKIRQDKQAAVRMKPTTKKQNKDGPEH